MEGGRDVAVRGRNERVRHHLRLAGNLSQIHQRVIDGVIADASDRNRAVARLPDRLFDGEFAEFACLPAIHVRGAIFERTLEIAERITTHALDAERGLDLLAQQVGKRAAAGKLDIAVCILLRGRGELDRKRRAIRAVNSF
jgi:hypothetical protein